MNASRVNNKINIDRDLQIQFIEDLNQKNNKVSIISETVQAMPIKFAVKTSATKARSI